MKRNFWIEIRHKLTLLAAFVFFAVTASAQSYFTPVEPTGLPYHVIISTVAIDGQPAQSGTEIGIFDGSLCVGSAVLSYTGQGDLDIVCWQGNPTYNLSGFTAGNQIIVRIYANLYGEWMDLDAAATFSTGNGNFGYGSFSSMSISAETGVAPEINVSKNIIDFGSVLLGNSSTEKIIITNTGTAKLTIQSIITNNYQFSLGNYTSQLSPGISDTIEITFNPGSATQIQTNMTISSDDPKASTTQILLVGQGAPQDQATIYVSTNSIDFGSVTIGDSVTQNIQIFNYGNQPLNISNIAVNHPDFSVSETTFDIPVGESHSLQITFAPNSSGSFNSSLYINSNAGNNSSYYISLSGSGYSGHFQSVEPTGLPYIIVINDILVDEHNLEYSDEIAAFDGELCVGFTIYTGSYPLQLTTWEGNASENLPGFTSGRSISFKLWASTYSNTVELTPDVSWIQGDGTFGYGDYSVAELRAKSGLEPLISVSKNMIEFQPTECGSTDQQTFMIYNTGKSQLLVNNINTNCSEFWVSQSYFTIAPQDSKQVTVYFSPGTPIFYTRTLTISSNDPNSPDFSLQLSGQGLAQQTKTLQVSTTPIRFTPTIIHDTSSVQLTLMNSGASIVNISSIYFSNPKFFTSYSEFSINPETAYQLPVSFSPTAIGTYNGTITIYNDSQNNSSVSISLSGVGYENYLEAVEPTGIPYTIIVDTMQSFSGLTPSVGDEIGIFDGRLCVGSIVIDPGVNTLSGIAWQENPSANLPGFKLGNPISFRYYARGESISNIYVVQYESVEGNGRFGTPPYASVKLNVRDILVYLNPPQNVIAIDSLQAITLKWNANTEDDLVYYNVYRSEFPDLAPDSTFFRGKIFAPDTTFIDSLIQNNTTYYYTVTAVDTAENESQPSLLTSVIAIVIKVWDVSFNQIRDGNAIVDIFYSFSGHDTTHYYITPYISFDEGKAWSIIETNIPTTLPGINITTNFNLMSTYPDIYLKDAKIKIDVSTFRKNQP